MTRYENITVCLVGFEKHKARPDLRDPSGFWLCLKAGDTSPFVAAFRSNPSAYHQFLIEQRVGGKTRFSTLAARIVKIEEGPAETRALIRPSPSVESAIGAISGAPLDSNPQYPWQQAVLEAFSELRPESLPAKINAAERAISARLCGPPEPDLEEHSALQAALRSLRVLLKQQANRQEEAGEKQTA